MSVARRIRRGGLAFVGVTVLWILVAPQVGVRARPGSVLPPLMADPGTTAVDRHGRDARKSRETTHRTEQVETQVGEAQVGEAQVGAGRSDALAAWITRPRPDRAGRRVPGVVLVSGAGARTRDDLSEVADALAARGVASIRYDKRRSGYGPLQRDFGGLAQDAAAAADTLAASAGVDPSRVGALGVSEGGWVLPMAADQRPDRFAFLVFGSAPVVSPAEQIAWIADRRLTSAPAAIRRLPPTFLASGRQTIGFTGTDVRPALSRLRMPVLALWGAEDPIVPVNEAARRLQQAVGTPLTIEVLPSAGHHLPLTSGYVDTVAAWILNGPGPDHVSGGEPVSDLGVGPLPPDRWYRRAPLHLATALLAALAVALLGARRAHPITNVRS